MELKLPNKEQMTDSMGRPITQSLFLEINYTEDAVYTLKDDHHEHKGVLYPSLKKLYLEMCDPTEYDFAVKYLLGWKHWQRLCNNKAIRKEIDEWREELEIKLRCEGIRKLRQASQMGNYQAAKFLADKGWAPNRAGRPSKDDIEHERKVQAGVESIYAEDEDRMIKLVK